MMEMRYVELNEICDVRDGTHDSPKYVQEGFPLVTSKNIIDGKLDLSTVNYLTQKDYDKINERSKVDRGDIIMPMIGTIGNPLLIGDFYKFAIKNVALIKFPNKNISNRYIWYFLKSDAFNKYVAEKNRGGTQKFLSLNDIRRMKVPYISYFEQISVVEKLDMVYKVIMQRIKELQLLDDLIKARFVEMFGDPVENPKKYYVAALRELIDKEYITYHLDGNHGGDYPRSDEFVDNGVPYISANCIVNGEVDFSRAKYLTPERASKLRKGIARDEDVLFAHNATVGPTVVLHTDEEKVILGTSLTAYRCNKKEIMPDYLKTYMLSDGFIQQYSAEMKQTTRNQVPITIQKKYLFLIPPIEEQRQFTDFVHQVDKSKVVVQKALDETQILFNSLMQQYFG